MHPHLPYDTSDRAQHQAHIFNTCSHLHVSAKENNLHPITHAQSGPVRILYLQSGPVRLVGSEKYPQPILEEYRNNVPWSILP